MYTEKHAENTLRSFYKEIVSEAVIVKMASHFFYRFLWEDSSPFEVEGWNRWNQELSLKVFSRNMGIVTVNVRPYCSGLHMESLYVRSDGSQFSTPSLIVTEGGSYHVSW